MPAATAPTLFKFEANVEDSALALLAAKGLTNAFGRTSEATATPSNNIVVEVSPFDLGSEHMIASADTVPVWFRNHFKGTLTYRITTKRDTAGQTYHEDAVGKIRAAHAALTNPFDYSPALPYQVMRSVISKGSFTYLKTGDRDVSELAYDLDIGILTGSLTFSAT